MRHALLVVLASLGFAVLATARPVTPGDTQTVSLTEKDQAIKAGPNDLIQVQIQGGQSGVYDLDVKTEGGLTLAGVVSSTDPHAGNNGVILIYLGQQPNATAGAVTCTYKDGKGKKHRGKVVITVLKK